VHLAGRLELNHWNGRTRVQLRLEDAAWAADDFQPRENPLAPQNPLAPPAPFF
jgi:hypothetical protein